MRHHSRLLWTEARASCMLSHSPRPEVCQASLVGVGRQQAVFALDLASYRTPTLTVSGFYRIPTPGHCHSLRGVPGAWQKHEVTRRCAFSTWPRDPQSKGDWHVINLLPLSFALCRSGPPSIPPSPAPARRTRLMSSPTMPVQEPLGSGAPYSPSSTKRRRYRKRSSSASSRSMSTQKPSKRSFPDKA